MGASTKVAIIGAGNVGGNLGIRFSKTGLAVKFGVRSDAKTKELLDKCKEASAVPVADAIAWGDVVFLALPGSAAMDVVRPLADELKGKIVVDCNNPLTWKDGPVWAPPAEGSLAQAIAKAVPGARVVKGFNTFGAEHHADPTLTGAPTQVFLAGDDAEAKRVVMAVATQAGFEPVDAGPLRNAPVLENLAILWIHLAMVGGQWRSFVFRMQKK